MSTTVQVEIVIPEGMGKVEALAKVSASLQGVIARKRREWRAARGEIAVLGPNVEERPACRLFVYRVARDFGGTPCVTCGIGMRKRSRYDGG